MLDACSNLQTYIDAEWTEANPDKTDLKYSYVEYNPNAAYPQILFEDGLVEHTWITKNLNKIIHEVKITIFIRPINYTPDVISTYKTTFRNMKSELDRILTLGKYSVTDINCVELSKWEDIELAVGRDIKSKKEPIEFIAAQTVKCIYYEEAS